MRILYLSNACPDEDFNRIFTEKEKPSQAAQKYHTLQIEGLREADLELIPLCIPAISRVTYKGLVFRHKSEGGYLFAPMINIPLIRHVWMFLYVFFFVFVRSVGKKGTAVICDVLNTTVSMAALCAGFLTGTQVVGIVTDVPSKRAFEIKNPFKRIASSVCNRMLGSYDKYIFLTQAMNDLINKKGRPYLISEGHVDRTADKVVNTLSEKYDKKVCLYAGSLRRIYGIPYLVEGFLEADIDNAELHIYGAGEYEEELRTLTEQHPTLHFFGVAPNGKIVEEERKATLLINPRPTTEEYTKYSFPSKNMEYMVSGTPTLTTRLPGMPREYEPFVYILDQENVQGMARKLKEILGQSEEELFVFGQKAKTFVLENKSNIKQAERICKLLSE